MKKILIAIIFLTAYVVTSYGFFGGDNPKVQNTILIQGDTTQAFDIFGAKNVMITVVDSSDTKVDTIYCFVQGGDTTSTVNFFWSQVALHDVAQTTITTNVSTMIPGDGVTKSYLIVTPDSKPFPFTRIWIIRSNKSTDNLYSPRTKIGIVSY